MSKALTDLLAKIAIKKRLKSWLGVVELELSHDHLEQRISVQTDRITHRIAELDKLTAIDGAAGVRGPCTIILSGVYRGKGYVAFYEMEHDEFQHFVEEYRQRKLHGYLRNIDAIPHYRGGAFKL